MPKRQWAAPLAVPVTTLARLTVVDTAAGVSPVASRIDDEVGPNPIPSAPSTNEAVNPASATSTRVPITIYSYQGSGKSRLPARDRAPTKAPSTSTGTTVLASVCTA